MTCSLAGKYQHFGGTYCFHLQGRRSVNEVLDDNAFLEQLSIDIGRSNILHDTSSLITFKNMHV
jgi:hypothetical protein